MILKENFFKIESSLYLSFFRRAFCMHRLLVLLLCYTVTSHAMDRKVQRGPVLPQIEAEIGALQSYVAATKNTFDGKYDEQRLQQAITAREILRNRIAYLTRLKDANTQESGALRRKFAEYLEMPVERFRRSASVSSNATPTAPAKRSVSSTN